MTPPADDVPTRVSRELYAISGLPEPAARREIREAAGLSQARLARAVGVSRSCIAQWESGARLIPRGPLLDKYVAALRELEAESENYGRRRFSTAVYYGPEGRHGDVVKAPRREGATLKAICDACKQPVSDGDGYLYVDMAEVNAVERAWADHEYEECKKTDHGRSGILVNGSDFLHALDDLPDPARWRVHHGACEPEPGPETDCYAIAVGRIRTWASLTDWSVHLMGKEWLRHTDWDQVLYSAARGSESRITPVRKPDPSELL